MPPQADYIKNCDYVMKLENISKDFLLVQKKLNCYKSIGIENRNNQKNYNLVYNEKTTGIVEQRYKIDFDLFY